MVRSSDRIRAAAHVLRLVLEAKIELDGETLGAIVAQLENVATDAAQLEARVIVRPERPRLSCREESLVALVHGAAELADPLFRPTILRSLDRLLRRGEVLS